MELRTRVSEAFLASAKSTEVLDCPRDDIVIEVEVDAARLIYSTSQPRKSYVERVDVSSEMT